MINKTKQQLKILITGGAGFIGSHLCEKYLELGHNVVCFDNFDSFYPKETKLNNISAIINHKNFCLVEVDIREKEVLLEAYQKYGPFDIVVHLAAKAGVRPSIENSDEYIKTNILGTNHLLDCVAQQKIKPKFIFASSSSVYGNNEKVPFSEDDPVDKPISPYACTKKAGEMLCYTYHHLYKIPTVCLRFFTVYGPRQRPDLAIHKFFKRILNNETIEIYGDGSTSRDYTYIDDIINAIIEISKNHITYDIFNLGSDKPIKLIELIKMIEDICSKKTNVVYKGFQPGDVNRTWANIDKIHNKILYIPKTKIETGLQIFYYWYKKKSNILVNI